MAPLLEGIHDLEFLLTHEDGLSFSTDTLAPNTAALVPGQLLGRVTASTKLVPYVNTATDGSEAVVAILCRNQPVSTVDTKVFVLDALAEVDGSFLVGLDAPGRADLKKLFIKVR
jgi:Bacteriophage lambda head decoration protein D